MSTTHTPGQTTQTSLRELQDFTRPVHQQDLEQEGASLLAEAAANPSHRAAKTLSKDSSMTVSLLAITAGTALMDHNTHGSALLQTLRGEVSVSLIDATWDLPPGQLITLASHVPHNLSARVDSVVLLVVAPVK